MAFLSRGEPDWRTPFSLFRFSFFSSRTMVLFHLNGALVGAVKHVVSVAHRVRVFWFRDRETMFHSPVFDSWVESSLLIWQGETA